MAKEFRAEFALRFDGSRVGDEQRRFFVKRLMDLRDDFRDAIDEFRIAEDAAADMELEMQCPLCDRIIPQVRYRRIERGEQA